MHEYKITDISKKKDEKKMVELVKSLMPEPIKGEPGKDADEQKIIDEVLQKIPKPKDGTPGKSFTKKQVKDLIEVSLAEKMPELMTELEGVGKVTVEELKNGFNLVIDGKKYFVGGSVVGPKLRLLVQMGDLDLPVGLVGQASKVIKVKTNETGFELGTVDTNISWGEITGTLSDQTDLQTALNAKFTLPNLTNGSVLYSDGTTITQNNQNLYYDNALHRLSAYGSLGSELVTNGTFSGSATGWTVGTGYAYSSNTVVHSSNGTAALSQTASGMNLGREHLCTFTISAWTVGTVTVSCGGVTGTAVGANGTYTFRFVPTNTNPLAFTPTNTARFTIDTVSVKVLTGGEIRTGYMNVDGSWSNGSPNTTRAMSFNNAGSHTWTDYLFAGVLRAATGANSSGGHDTYTSGGNGAAYYNGNSGLTSNSMYSYNYSGYFYHYGNIQAVGHGMFGGKVGAGTGASTTPTSTLTVNGGEAKKTRRVTTNTTLDDTAYFWIVDASTPSCNGTPSVTTCSTYTASGQAVCESHLPCAWFAGNSCSAFNNEYGMGSCSGTGGCSADTSSCSSAGDESSCTSQNSSYGGSCAWSGSDCSGFDESQCGSYSGSGCTVNTSDCSTFNGNEGGCTGTSGCSVSASTCSSQGDESSCLSAGCSWDGMSCTGDNSTCSGSYFTGCTGTYYSCTGTYYSGNCSGTYGAACSGTATCSGYASSGACTGEAGCSWVTAATITLPDSAVLPNYSCAIYNGSSTGADVNIVAPAGHTVDVSVLSAYKDSVILQGFNDARQCSEFSSAGACTPTGCTANYFNCSWNSGDNTCSGNAVCDGIGDQSTCESTSYFSSCSGTWYASKNYYRLAS